MKSLKKRYGFTLAEILITLSIIGIVAAISIPSLLVNINDKTYDAQRNALVARMSQAIGQMDAVSAFERGANVEEGGTTKYVDQSSAIAFITKGLANYYKISSICGVGHLDSCDISDEIKVPNGTNNFKISEHQTFSTFNAKMSEVMSGFDTNIAGFKTTNGESILVYYNPKCQDQHEKTVANVFSEVCVNMIFDLNGGSKAPNQFGKDIGFLTILYPSTPSVVAPVPDSTDATSAASFGTPDAAASCSTESADLILPDRDSLIAMVLNKDLIGNLQDGASAVEFWSATVTEPGAGGKAWAIKTDGAATLAERNASKSVRCIKK